MRPKKTIGPNDAVGAHTQRFYGSLDFVWDNPSQPVPEETFTNSHLSWSSIVPYLLHPSNTETSNVHIWSSHFLMHSFKQMYANDRCHD